MITLLLAAALPIAGCAVTTIDVDVYKGPLANHDDVQMEQLITIAIAARPLLIELRDNLEDRKHSQLQGNHKDRIHTRGLKHYLSALADKCRRGTAECELKDGCKKDFCIMRRGYVDGFIEVDAQGQPLCDDTAIRVNAILSLYNNQDSQDYSQLVDEAQSIKKTYIIHYNRFVSPQTELQSLTFHTLRFLFPFLPPAFYLELVPDLSNHRKAGPQFAAAPNGQKINVNQRALALRVELDSYFTTKAGHAVFAERVANAYRDLHASLAFDRALQSLITPVPYAGTSVIDSYEFLRKKEVADAIAEIVTRPTVKSAKGAAVANEISEIADAFLASLAGLTQGLTMALRSIELVASDSALPTHERERLLRAATKVAVNLLRQGGSADFGPQLAAFHPPAAGVESRDDFARKAKIAIESNYTTVARLLAARHAELINSGVPSQRFGLVRFPLPAAAEIAQEVELQTALDSFFDAGKRVTMSGAGLGEGRLPQGLASLITDYYVLRHKYPQHQPNAEVDTKQRQLIDELVHFAQKLVHMANHVTLIESSSSTSLVRNPDTFDTPHATTSDPTGHGLRQSYSRVLQAVGNSILVQADEVRQRWKWQHDVPTARQREVNTLAAGTPATTGDMIALIMRRLYGERDALQDQNSKHANTITRLQTEIPGHQSRATSFDTNFTSEAAAAALDQTNAAAAGALAAAEDAKAAKAAADIAKFTGLIQSDPANAAAHTLMLQAAQMAKATAETAATTARANEQAALARAKAADARANNWKQQKQFEEAEATRKSQEIITVTQTVAASAARVVNLQSTIPLVETFRAALTPQDLQRRARMVEVLDTLYVGIRGQGNTSAHVIAPQVIESLSIRELSASDYAQGAQHPAAAIDQYISKLEQEYREAVKMGGKSSSLATNIRQAIEAAYAYRSGLVYIRPPSSFLRTSYPVTSLQNNVSAEWQNMLMRHGLRTTPLIGEGLDLGAPSQKDRETLSEIDKTYWQNINRVRVAGNGVTNYVMVKDDIGNWYVKNFEADPEPIIKAAKALALASASLDTGANYLLRDQELIDRAKGGTKGLTPVTPDSRALKQAKSFAKKYDDDARKQASGLDSKLSTATAPTGGNLLASLKAGWAGKESDTTEAGKLAKALTAKFASVDPRLKSAAEAFAAAAKEPAPPPPAVPDETEPRNQEPPVDPGVRLIDGMWELHRFHGTAASLIDTTAAEFVAKAEKAVADSEASLKKQQDVVTQAKAAQRGAEDALALAESQRADKEKVFAANKDDVAARTELAAAIDHKNKAFDVVVEKKKAVTEAEAGLKAPQDALTAAQATLSEVKQVAAAARQSLASHVANPLRDAVADRKQAAATYETSLAVLFETVSTGN